MQAVAGEIHQRCVAELHACQVTAAVGQPFHGGQAVRYTAVRQSLRVVRMSGLMLPEQCFRLRVMHRLTLTGQAAFLIIPVIHRHPVPFADMADVCQPAAFVILPPLCGFAIHGAVREAVCFVIVPVGDQPLILAADKFAGQVVVITLCAAVKAGFLYQPVEYIVTEGGVAAVFTGQADDPSGSIVFHTARQPALRGTDGLSPRIVLCPVSAAVRGNDGGQVTGDVVFIPRFMALRVFHGN
ncbi:Uncharacterised protein [Escherichia coli]|nr:Uncharacterised protein [Escherichia coli]